MSEGAPKRDWLRSAGVRMTAREYRANLEGLGIFFGAILGVVMTDIGDVAAPVYALVLTLVASFVRTIIYITASAQRRTYAIYAAITLVALWSAVHRFGGEMGLQVQHFDRRVFPTLGVWLAMTILIEFAPRDVADKDQTA